MAKRKSTKRKSKKQPEFTFMQRVLLMSTGFGILLFLWVGTFGPEKYLNFELIGTDITVYVVGAVTILLGIVAGSLFKSGILGKWKMD